MSEDMPLRLVYGKWAGNERGTLENTTRCIKKVWGGGFISYQCHRKRGFGPGGMYCKQHAKMVEKHPFWTEDK